MELKDEWRFEALFYMPCISVSNVFELNFSRHERNLLHFWEQGSREQDARLCERQLLSAARENDLFQTQKVCVVNGKFYKMAAYEYLNGLVCENSRTTKRFSRLSAENLEKMLYVSTPFLHKIIMLPLSSGIRHDTILSFPPSLTNCLQIQSA